MSKPSPNWLDPGLQAERTAISWRRTGFSYLVIGGLMLHVHDGMDHRIALPLGLSVLAFAGWVYATGLRRYRQSVAAVRGGRSVVRAGYFKALAAGMIIMHVYALIMLFSSHKI